MEHTIGYNNQRDNLDFNGKFKGSWQCFSTCAWMFMSFYDNTIIAEDDGGLSKYLDDVEDSIGSPGIGEIIKRKYNWITGSTSYWWLVQQAGIQKWFQKDNIDGNVVFSDNNQNFSALPALLEKGPVILNTAGLGGTAGHIILGIGYDDASIICHDPYGDANSNYTNGTGISVKYEKSFLEKYTGKELRCIYLKK